MKHITILVPDGQSNLSTVACIVGTYEILTVANKHWQDSGRKSLYKIELAGVSKKAKFHQGLISVTPHVTISSLAKTNLIIIPSLVRDFEIAMKGNKAAVAWMQEQHKKGAEIASMCTGAFMLASTGLLDGKSCSTHWGAENTFKAKFPNVKLQPQTLITDESGLYTNGGAYSFLNLVIYLVEKYFDRRTAIYCAKIFQIEMDRNTQSGFAIFAGQKLHGDEMVHQAQAFIEKSIDEKISVEHLSSKFAVGRRNFDRRFIKATGNTPVEYSQRVKVESAKKAFESTRKTVNEVMYEVGYSDVKAFREVFRRITGMSPLAYRGKYNKELVVS